MTLGWFRRAILSAAIIFFGLSPLTGLTAAAQSSSTGGSVSGAVADQVSGLPVSGADVDLIAGDKVSAHQVTDTRGAFTFSNVAQGIYTVRVNAGHFVGAISEAFAVINGQQSQINFALTRAQAASAEKLRTIASATATGRNAIASTTTITRTIDPAVLQNEGYLRFGDSLRTLPGVNFAGLSSSVGDDLYVDVRGMGETETQALLDGHPVGLMGVYGINRPFGNHASSFNYADSPYFALNKVQVTFGSGASGLYGTDATGGTIDMESLAPTLESHYDFLQAIGDQGKDVTAFKATGTVLNRLGYAFAGSIQGTYGLFSPQTIPQTGRPNNNLNLPNNGACTGSNDLTSCNLALNTYGVSQDTTLRSGLAKLQLNLSRNTTLSGTAFASGQWADSTGNGDNDFIPYDTRVAQITANATPDKNCQASNPAAPYAVILDSGPACYSAQQWATASNGPLGGGAGRNRGTNMVDYHTRLQSVSGRSTYTVDYYLNHYKFFKSSQYAPGLDPTGQFTVGNVYSQFLNTQGILISDDITNATSEFGFGYFGEHQQQTRLDFQFTAPNLYAYEPPLQVNYGSAFVRASGNITPTFSVFANAWLKKSSVTQQTNFDPRVSLVLRPPSRHDVFRFTYGRTTGDPAAELKAGAFTLSNQPSSLTTYSCTPYNSEFSGPNPNITAEKANDFELGYAHQFAGDTSIQVNAYTTSVQNQLFTAVEPLTQFGAPPIDPAILLGFAQKIACPGVTPSNPNSVIPFLGVATTFNAAQAQYRGIEISGRVRLNPNVYADYSWNEQTAIQNGIPVNILQSNPTIINGAQIANIPTHQASFGLDYSNTQGWEARIDGFFVGDNNVSQRPAYNFWNGFVAKNLTKSLSAKIGVWNVFNEATQNYGYIGHQLFIPENQYFHDSNSVQQAAVNGVGEEFGIASRSILFTLNESL